VHFNNVAGFADGSTREDIKNLLQDYGPIAWVDFNKGDEEVRFIMTVSFLAFMSISYVCNSL